MNRRNREQLENAKRYGGIVGSFYDGWKQRLVSEAAYQDVAQHAGVVICDRHGQRTVIVDPDGTPICSRCLEEQQS